MTPTDNATRLLGALLIMLGVVAFILIGASHSPLKGFPIILLVPVFFIGVGAYFANRAKS